jgi:hypothetical protein
MNNLNFIMLNGTDKNANIIPMNVNKNHIVRIATNIICNLNIIKIEHFIIMIC